MNEGLIPNRYAKALYKYAVENGQQQSVYDEVKRLAASYEALPELKAAVCNPFIAVNEKEKVLLTAAGAKPGSCLDRFLLLVIDKNRVDYLRAISLAYLKQYRHDNGIANVEIVTATEMPDQQINAIVDVVKKQQAGKSLEISKSVDRDLIGGFTVNVDGQVLDASVKNELKKLRLKLLS